MLFQFQLQLSCLLCRSIFDVIQLVTQWFHLWRQIIDFFFRKISTHLYYIAHRSQVELQERRLTFHRVVNFAKQRISLVNAPLFVCDVTTRSDQLVFKILSERFSAFHLRAQLGNFVVESSHLTKPNNTSRCCYVEKRDEAAFRTCSEAFDTASRRSRSAEFSFLRSDATVSKEK